MFRFWKHKSQSVKIQTSNMAIETANVVDLLFVFEWINDGKKAWVPEVPEREKKSRVQIKRGFTPCSPQWLDYTGIPHFIVLCFIALHRCKTHVPGEAASYPEDLAKTMKVATLNRFSL